MLQVIGYISPDEFDDYEQLMGECGFSDFQDFLNHSYSFFKEAVQGIREGRIVCLVDENNQKIIELKAKWMDNVRRAIRLRLLK